MGSSPPRSPAPISDAVALEFPRVLVVCGNLITAESVTIALNQLTFAARFVVPVTLAHLQDLVGWRPTAALVDVDSVETNIAVSGTAALCAAGIAVVAMAGRHESQAIAQCLAAGAATVVEKDAPLSRLTDVVRRIMAGELALGEAERSRLAASYERRAGARNPRLAAFDVLTTREKIVLSELMDGHVAEVIAGRSSVALSTVRSQIKSILQKLGVNSQLAAAGLARNAGWTFEGPTIELVRPHSSRAEVSRSRQTSALR